MTNKMTENETNKRENTRHKEKKGKEIEVKQEDKPERVGKEWEEGSSWRNPITETCSLCDINADVRVKHGQAQAVAVWDAVNNSVQT